MNSATLPSFWNSYYKLDRNIKEQTKKAYRLWADNPFHPSLRFKCINKPENIWAARVSLGYRSVGILDGETITWFWVGSHDQYERLFG